MSSHEPTTAAEFEQWLDAEKQWTADGFYIWNKADQAARRDALRDALYVIGEVSGSVLIHMSPRHDPPSLEMLATMEAERTGRDIIARFFLPAGGGGAFVARALSQLIRAKGVRFATQSAPHRTERTG
jgi:phytoene dehydrogenase-like protein